MYNEWSSINGAEGLPLANGLRFCTRPQGAWVQSLIGELRPHTTHSYKKIKMVLRQWVDTSVCMSEAGPLTHKTYKINSKRTKDLTI